MDSDIWLPLIALVLGWALAQVTEVLKDRRAIDRERQARQAELQRATLLALQDAALELSNLASEVNLTRFIITLEYPDEASKEVAEERDLQAKTRLREASRKAQLLLSRVQDDQARKDADLLIRAADMVRILDQEAADKNLRALHTRYGKLIDRLGELLRERY
jgi:hypothetical protein